MGEARELPWRRALFLADRSAIIDPERRGPGMQTSTPPRWLRIYRSDADGKPISRQVGATRSLHESFIGIVSPENKDSGPLPHLLPIDFLVNKQTSWSCVKPGTGKFSQFAVVGLWKL